VAALSMSKLDKYMRNQGKGNFDFEGFKAMYDADPKIQALVTNFDQEKIEFKQSEMDDVVSPSGATGDTVGNMAKSATDVGAKL
jgi:hypothetical protein